MNIGFARIWRAIALATVVLGLLMLPDDIDAISKGNVVTTAQAVIGRPLTPVSYAGVARRTTRRAVAAGAAVGAAAAAPVVVAPTCVQAVDAYGRIYTRCY